MPMSPEGDYYEPAPARGRSSRPPRIRDEAFRYLWSRALVLDGANVYVSTSRIARTIGVDGRALGKVLRAWPDHFHRGATRKGRRMWRLADEPARAAASVARRRRDERRAATMTNP